MPLTVNSLVSQIQDTLGVDDTDDGFAAADVIGWVNQVLWEIDNQFRFRSQDISYTFVTVEGDRDYSITTAAANLASLETVSIEDPNSLQHTDLKRMTVTDYESVYVNDDDAYGKPTHYLRYGDNLRLWPTPDDEIYTITIYCQGKISDLAAGQKITTIPNEWQVVLYYGAVAAGYFRQQQFRKFTIADNKYKELKEQLKPVEAKEEADSHSAGVTVLRTPYLRRFR